MSLIVTTVFTVLPTSSACAIFTAITMNVGGHGLASVREPTFGPSRPQVFCSPTARSRPGYRVSAFSFALIYFNRRSYFPLVAKS